MFDSLIQKCLVFYSLGINQYGVSKRLNKNNYYDSLRAEIDAIQKLPINKKNKMIRIMYLFSELVEVKKEILC